MFVSLSPPPPEQEFLAVHAVSFDPEHKQTLKKYAFLNEWMDGRMEGGMDGWMIGWIDG